MRHFLLILFLTASLHGLAQQTRTVAGLVRTVAGEPLPGVSVALAGGTTGTTTDDGGRFVLRNVPAGEVTLRATFVGFQPLTQTVAAGNNQPIDLRLTDAVGQLAEVIVSTQKRAESIIDVPLAIAAVDGEFLKRQRVQELDALSNYIPGLQVQLQSPNNPGFVIRGVTSDDGDSRSQARVSVFQDGVQISRSRGAAVELFDMERVEVAKGPQGTLFGRGAQIGAVHLIQNKARMNQSAEVQLSYGNFNALYAQAYINQPLGTKLALRVSGVASKRDGFIENLSGGTLNGKGTYAGRVALRYLPSNRSTFDLLLNYQYDDYPGTSFKSGRYAPAGGDVSPNSAASLEQGTNLFIRRKLASSTLLWNQQLTNRLTLNSISAFRWFDSFENFDADGTAAPALFFAELANSRQFSQELRLNYQDNGRFSGFGGVSYFYENGAQRVPLYTDERSFFALLTPILRASIPTLPLVPLLVNGQPNLSVTTNIVLAAQVPPAGPPLKPFHTESYANFGRNVAYEAFADGTYRLAPNLNLSAGVRATYEEQTGGYQADAAPVPSSLGLLLGNGSNVLFRASRGRLSTSKDYWSAVGRLVLDYKFGDHKVYLSTSRGRRPGVIQISPTDTILLRPETVLSYEVGLKGLLLAGRLQYDLAGYYYDWSNFQTSSSVFQNGTLRFLSFDTGKARSTGAELGLRYGINRQSSVYGSYSYIDGKFSETDSENRPQQRAGNRFRLTPQHQMALGLDLNLPVGTRFNVYVRPNFTYKSQVYFEDTNQSNLVQGGYGLVNLNTGIEFNGKPRITVGFFGKNLTDRQFIIDAGNTGNAFGIPTFIAGAPRLAGVELRIRF